MVNTKVNGTLSALQFWEILRETSGTEKPAALREAGVLTLERVTIRCCEVNGGGGSGGKGGGGMFGDGGVFGSGGVFGGAGIVHGDGVDNRVGGVGIGCHTPKTWHNRIRSMGA
ncbi:hypothetical protein Tco_1027819 [Tanacetum coccineum]